MHSCKAPGGHWKASWNFMVVTGEKARTPGPSGNRRGTNLLCTGSGEGRGETGLQWACLYFHLIFNHLKDIFVICWFFELLEMAEKPGVNSLLGSYWILDAEAKVSFLSFCSLLLPRANSCLLPLERSFLYRRISLSHFPAWLFPLPKVPQRSLSCTERCGALHESVLLLEVSKLCTYPLAIPRRTEADSESSVEFYPRNLF